MRFLSIQQLSWKYPSLRGTDFLSLGLWLLLGLHLQGVQLVDSL
jgi:hypothetical protein